MLAWAEELGAEATTVTELLEEDNEEVGLCAYFVAGVSLRKAQILRSNCIICSWKIEEVHAQWVDTHVLQVKLEIMAQIQKVNRKAISNAQKVNDRSSEFWNV